MDTPSTLTKRQADQRTPATFEAFDAKVVALLKKGL
jgi:hypothetical protein